MKPQTLLIMAGIATAVATASCQFFEEKKSNEEADANSDYIGQVNAHIDRRLAEYNEKEEARLPIFIPREAKADFQDLSFIKTAAQIATLSIDFAGPGDTVLSVVFDRDSRTFTRTMDGKSETYTFEPFTNGIAPVIPYDAHILYAFATNFNRIADRIELRSFKRLESGENPAISEVETEAANEGKKGKKKVVVEIENKTVYEPVEFRIDNRWCHCYDVKLKSFCAPAVGLSLFVSNEEKTISRVDVIMDDDSRESFIVDWREQEDGIVLPRVIQHLGKDSNAVFFREDAKVILKSAAPADIEEAVEEQNAEQYAQPSGEDQGYEYDAEAGEKEETEAEAEEEDADF